LLRAVPVPANDTPSWATTAGLRVLYALTPFSATPSARLDLTLANTTGLPAGTAVDLVRVGTNYFGAKEDAGQLVVFGSGTVSADGKTITSDAGKGLDEITFLGVRAKQ
jgi:hypothetical protein